jgi:ribosomal protein S27AE
MRRIGNVHNEHEFTGQCDICGEKFMAFESELDLVVESKDVFKGVSKYSNQDCPLCGAGNAKLTLNKAVK